MGGWGKRAALAGPEQELSVGGRAVRVGGTPSRSTTATGLACSEPQTDEQCAGRGAVGAKCDEAEGNEDEGRGHGAKER